MALNLVEVIERSSELTHAEFHLYMCYVAHIDEVTGISRPSNLVIKGLTGLGYSSISKLKASLAGKVWIEQRRGRRVVPLVGSKSSSQENFSGAESATAPKEPPVKSSPQENFSPRSEFSEGTAEAENSPQENICDRKNSPQENIFKNSPEENFSPTPPYKDQSIAREDQKQLASLPPKNLPPEEFRARYGRDWGDPCDERFIRSMQGHADFRQLTTHRKVYQAMVKTAKKRLTCGRYVAWLRKELEFGTEKEREDATDRREAERNQGPDRGAAGAVGTVQRRAEDDRFRPAKVIGTGF